LPEALTIAAKPGHLPTITSGRPAVRLTRRQAPTG
jgi:hypothetical protein